MKLSTFCSFHLFVFVGFALQCALAESVRSETGFEAEFNAANKLFEEGRFQDAAVFYQKILEERGHSAAVHYNLGNAYYQTGQPGRAVLHYERALLLNPSHAEAKANLEVVRRMSGAREYPKPWSERFFRHVPPGGVAWVGVAAAWVSLVGGWFCVRRGAWQAHGIVAVAMSLPLALACLWLLLSSGGGAWNASRAIVIQEGAVARHAPAKTSREILSLAPGSEIALLFRRTGWAYVLLPDRGRGWLPEETVETIR